MTIWACRCLVAAEADRNRKGPPVFERDYLMNILLQYAEILRRSWFKARRESDPRGAAVMLEAAVGQATDIDGATLLSLSPESMAGVLQVSGVDDRVAGYIARSLALASSYLNEAGDRQLAALRFQQARALADAYGVELPDSADELAALADRTEGGCFSEADEPALVDIEGSSLSDAAPMVETFSVSRD